jgi:hypothetical protein
MTVLTLTWEFPPLITGGLGMACYGIVKSLLRLGVSVDLIVPTKESVCFALRKERDADDLPVVFLGPNERRRRARIISAKQLLQLMGTGAGAYDAPRRRVHARPIADYVEAPEFLRELLDDAARDHHLFRQVREFTQMAVAMGLTRSFDMIHAHDWMTFPAAIILKRITGKPLVIHVHSTEFDRAGGPGDVRVHDVEYLGMILADRLIAVSGYTANTIARCYGINAEKTRVVHNAYTVSRPPSRPRRIFKEPTVVFMGRITLQKGPDYFLEVARRVLRHNRHVRFVMAGTGDMERQILHKAASHGMGTRFLFAGFLGRDDVARLLAATDIFVLPSVSEPFGIAPLEAMSYGAVAIISKQSGVAEVVQNAYKVDFWDVDRIVSIILDMTQHPDKRSEVAKKAVIEVAALEWEDAAEKIKEVYSEVGV